MASTYELRLSRAHRLMEKSLDALEEGCSNTDLDRAWVDWQVENACPVVAREIEKFSECLRSFLVSRGVKVVTE